jgi:putative ABC transport system substrate-binding protein
VAATWPLAARAQQRDRIRRIGVLLFQGVIEAWFTNFTRGLQQLGWASGRNLRMDVRRADGVDLTRMFAKELVDLQPDVILANATPVTAALQRETRTIPIVFVMVSDPVGSGFVAGLARPGGNITGFMIQESSMGGKWLQLLTEIAPHVTRVAMLFSPDAGPYVGAWYQPSFEAAARSLKVVPIAVPIHNDTEIEAVITSFGRERGHGVVVMPDGFASAHRAQIISLAAQNNIPAVNMDPTFAREGGLLSYGPDIPDIWRRSASYVDRILKGEKPADLPVQQPTKFDLVINLKTAKALGLTVPPSLFALADEVIE